MRRLPAILLCILLAGPAGLALVASPAALAADPPPKSKSKGGKDEPPPPDARFLEQPAMTVNIQGGRQGPNFVSLRLTLELADAADRNAVAAVAPRVADYLMPLIRELKPEAFRSSVGLTRLRSELLLRVNMATAPYKVADVLFGEIIFQ
jgi:flagellar FliL protein